MPQYTLHYFNLRGIAEVSRLIFVQAGVEYTDHRFELNEWPEEKKDSVRYPLGVTPTLEVEGKILPESIPLARYVAVEFGLAGKDNWQRAWCDVIVDVLKETRDYLKPFMTFYRTEKDEAKFEEQKAQTFANKVQKKLAILEGFLKSNNEGKGFFVGEGVTWADLYFIDNAEILLELKAGCLDGTPLLKALFDRVHALPNIKKHVETRPKTFM